MLVQVNQQFGRSGFSVLAACPQHCLDDDNDDDDHEFSSFSTLAPRLLLHFIITIFHRVYERYQDERAVFFRLVDFKWYPSHEKGIECCEVVEWRSLWFDSTDEII